MGIITFLKEWYNNHLVRKLSKLQKLSNEYCKIIDSLCNHFTHLSISSFFNSQYGNSYLAEELTMQYDFYYYYKALYNRTLTKIERLEHKLEIK